MREFFIIQTTVANIMQMNDLSRILETRLVPLEGLHIAMYIYIYIYISHGHHDTNKCF